MNVALSGCCEPDIFPISAWVLGIALSSQLESFYTALGPFPTHACSFSAQGGRLRPPDVSPALFSIALGQCTGFLGPLVSLSVREGGHGVRHGVCLRTPTVAWGLSRSELGPHRVHYICILSSKVTAFPQLTASVLSPTVSYSTYSSLLLQTGHCGPATLRWPEVWRLASSFWLTQQMPSTSLHGHFGPTCWINCLRCYYCIQGYEHSIRK